MLTGIAPPQGATSPVVTLAALEPGLCRMDSPEWTEAAARWREAKAIQKEAESYEATCRETLVNMALATGKARAKGNDVFVSIDKNGVAHVRCAIKEQTA